MEKYDLHKKEVELHNIILSITSPIDYEMSRWYLLENMPNCKYDEYVILEGYHCSCYDFNDTDWEAMKYTEEEIEKIARDRLENCCDSIEKEFYKLVFDYFNWR